MSDPKDNGGFLRKVVKFVANPATDWSDLADPSSGERETDLAKTEMKAMIERKRRNDFVRKREFDMLRRVRREGLTSEQLASLGTASRLDNSDLRQTDTGVKADSSVKAKIDEIEQQMVGDNRGAQLRKASEFAGLGPTTTTRGRLRSRPVPLDSPRSGHTWIGETESPSDRSRISLSPTAQAATVSGELPPLDLDMDGPEFSALDSSDSQINDVAHDPELDEAVIAFANAEFDLCEQSLTRLTAASGPRAQHAETWLVRFDLYRAIGQQQKFESLALEYAQRFGWSAPQWYSMPKLVADASASEAQPAHPPLDVLVGWVCPAVLDADGVSHLASKTLQLPLPWVLDWSALNHIDAEGASRLSELFRKWIVQPMEMRWLGGDHLFDILREAAPVGMRDVDPAYWQLRFDALRMVNRADQFDEAAIDFCVTYEVSPPSWERATCKVRVSNANGEDASIQRSAISDMSTGFAESQLLEDANQVVTGTVDLAGQLVGDISSTLKKLDHDLAAATIINVSCARLIRVDFIAAGDLLNWVLARCGERRKVNFIDAHRLVALFFGAMGINEHARIGLREV
jgi:hypothetical protein